MNIAADRGGPFVRSTGTARNWMRAAAPGIAFRFPSDESSPIGQGSDTNFASETSRRPQPGLAKFVSDPAFRRRVPAPPCHGHAALRRAYAGDA